MSILKYSEIPETKVTTGDVVGVTKKDHDRERSGMGGVHHACV